MRAVVCREYGPPESLAVLEVATRAPEAREVKIAVHRASINYFDVLMVQGQYQRNPPLPFVAGSDAAGEVLAVGLHVTKMRPGDRVAAFDWGGAFAEEITVPQDQVFILPAEVGYTAAAALKSVYGTALYALQTRAQIIPGANVVVLGATGGVGMALLEIGQLMGARMIAVVRQEEHAEAVLQAGAHEVIDLSREPLRESVLRLTGGLGADAVMDPVGGDLFDQAVRALAWGGKLCTIGYASGRIPSLPANIALLKGIDILGVNYGAWIDRAAEQHRQQTEMLLRWCAQGRIKPHVSMERPLQDAGLSMRMLLERRSIGKIVLKVR